MTIMTTPMPILTPPTSIPISKPGSIFLSITLGSLVAARSRAIKCIRMFAFAFQIGPIQPVCAGDLAIPHVDVLSLVISPMVERLHDLSVQVEAELVSASVAHDLGTVWGYLAREVVSIPTEIGYSVEGLNEL